jgi:hypothetical protein
MTATPGSARTAVQKAIFNVLASTMLADDLTSLVSGRVYDNVPRGSAFPYVAVRDSETDDASTSSTNDVSHLITIDCWSRQLGNAEVGRILGAIRDRLQDFQGTFDGHIIVDCHFVGDLTFEEEDLTRHGVARFAVLSEPA